VLKSLVTEGISPARLPQIIAIMDSRLRDNPDAGADTLAQLFKRRA